MRHFLLLLMAALVFTNCENSIEEACFYPYYIYEPVYQNIEAIREVNFESGREIERPGKIYVYGDYLMVNEMGKGIHIIDNSDQRNPQNIGFYNIKGNNDLAVKNNVLYADNYLDVMAIDISNITHPQKIGAAENVYDYPYFIDSESQQLIVDYQVSDVQYFECQSNWGDDWGGWVTSNGFTEFTGSTNMALQPISGVSVTPNLVTGQAGSIARFALSQDFLYVVDHAQLHALEIDSPQNIQVTNSSNLDWGVETIFPYQNNLFIGAQTGMHIFSLDNPSTPAYASTYTHFEACDPVVVRENIAYVTLRDGNNCGESVNELLKLDVQNIYEPQLLQTMDMTNPYGLGIYNEKLFVCELEHGIRVYDKTDINDYIESQIASILDVDARDIILLANETAIVLSDDNFKQYDFSDINHIEELSEFLL